MNNDYDMEEDCSRNDDFEDTEETEEPDLETLEEWVYDGVAESTDGCGGIELDGHCQHGKPSWLLKLGMI